MPTPTSRSLALLKSLGFLPAVVESWIPVVHRRRDLWGFGDILACHPRDRLFLIVQATSISNSAARVSKACGRAELALWLKSGGLFEVWGWRDREVKRIAVNAADLTTTILEQPNRRKRDSQQTLF